MAKNERRSPVAAATAIGAKLSIAADKPGFINAQSQPQQLSARQSHRLCDLRLTEQATGGNYEA